MASTAKTFQEWVKLQSGNPNPGRIHRIEVSGHAQTKCPHCHKMMARVGIQKTKVDATHVIIHIGENDGCYAIVAKRQVEPPYYFIPIDELRDPA